MLVSIFLLIITGWAVFSVAAGTILYCSSLTVKFRSSAIKKNAKVDGLAVFALHTTDPLIMEPLNSAKERWKLNRANRCFKEISIISRDNLVLKGWYWPCDNLSENGINDRTVILVHGLMDSGAGTGYLAEEYHCRNWNVLCIDQRSHGESEGNKITMGVRESDDIALWIDLLNKNFHVKELFLHGVSMGGATILLYAGRTKTLPSIIKGIISDSSYASYHTSFSRLIYLIVKNRFISWSITCGASLASAVFSGVPFYLMNPERMIHIISIPVLLFHGEKDMLLTAGMVQKMFGEAEKQGNETVVIPDAPHIGAYFYESTKYMQKIETFVQKCI